MANGEGSGLDAGSGAAVGRGLEANGEGRGPVVGLLANGEGRGLDAVGAAVLANGDGSGFVVGLLANGEGSGLDGAVLANGDGSALPPAGAIFENGEGIAVDAKFILSKIEGIFYSIYIFLICYTVVPVAFGLPTGLEPLFGLLSANNESSKSFFLFSPIDPLISS